MAGGPLGRQLAEVAASYARPIYWPIHSGDSISADEIRNGTTFFVDSGALVFGVTAGHVYDQFIEAATSGCKCQIGASGQLFDLRERLIARGKTVDIATYRIDRAEIASTGATILTGWQSTWPPKPAEVDKGLVYAGFPGADRRLLSSRVIEFGIWHGSGVANSVNDRDVSCLIEREHVVATMGLKLPPEGCDLAGMSGAPVLAMVQSEVVGWRLAGVIYECGRQLCEVIKATRADYILADGAIRE